MERQCLSGWPKCQHLTLTRVGSIWSDRTGLASNIKFKGEVNIGSTGVRDSAASRVNSVALWQPTWKMEIVPVLVLRGSNPRAQESHEKAFLHEQA